MRTLLLKRTSAPLNRLALHRIQLDTNSPMEVLEAEGAEALLYSLTGRVTITVDGLSLGSLGIRHSVLEPSIQAARVPTGSHGRVVVNLQGYAADLLWVTCEPVGKLKSTEQKVPYGHFSDSVAHAVGTGTHQREVRVIDTPTGYEIEAGETLNIPGGVSSWPAHANTEDVAKFQCGETTWEECMFFACAKPGIAVLDGYYNAYGSHGMQQTKEVFRVENGTAHAMPLGSHSLYSAPDAFLYYAWFYCGDALKKSYRKWATDLGTYVS